MFIHTQPKHSQPQGGFILAYVLFAISLISISMAVLARSNSTSDSGRKQAEVRDDLVQQAELIRAKLIACSVNYPAGNNGTGLRATYPATPVNSEVADLVCPGAPAGATALWSGLDGIYSPKVLTGFSTWKFSNDTTSMRIVITINSSTPSLQAGLRSAALKLGEQANTTANSVLILTLAR